MVFESGALNATLAAAAGDDAALMAELRSVFVESARRQLDLLKRSRCDGNWTIAAMRLKGLAASFHAGELSRASEEALVCAPGEPTVIRKIENAICAIESN